MKFENWVLFQKFVEKLQVSLQSDQNDGYFTWRPICIFDHISLSSSYNEKYCRQNVVEKIRTNILGYTTFLKNRAFYEIIWRNIVKPDMPQMATWGMRIACSIPKATNTHSEYVILIAFPWAGQSSRCSDWPLAGRSENRIPVGARFSAPVQTGPGVHPDSYSMGTGSFPGVKRPERDVDHPPHLAPRLKKE
jgi:hypothetical protein